VCTIGYLFNIHPRISNHSHLQKHLYAKLEKIAITVKEAQELDKTTKDYLDSNFNETYIPCSKFTKPQQAVVMVKIAPSPILLG